MGSELLKFIIDNIDNLKTGDYLIIVVIILCLATAIFAIIQWIYSHAFKMQGEVVKSQKELILIKDQAIHQYEESINTLKDENKLQREDNSKSKEELEHLEGQYKGIILNNKLQEYFATTMQIGVFKSLIILSRLELCNNFRYLVKVYTAVKEQHHEQSGIKPEILFEKITSAEFVYLEQAKVLSALGDISMENINEFDRSVIVKNADYDPFYDLEDLIVKETLPILIKFEPKFGARVRASYEKRQKKS